MRCKRSVSWSQSDEEETLTYWLSRCVWREKWPQLVAQWSPRLYTQTLPCITTADTREIQVNVHANSRAVRAVETPKRQLTVNKALIHEIFRVVCWHHNGRVYTHWSVIYSSEWTRGNPTIQSFRWLHRQACYDENVWNTSHEVDECKLTTEWWEAISTHVWHEASLSLQKRDTVISKCMYMKSHM